jgi:hypothetical protein
MRVIIARYQEDVSWANGVPNCIIYNKSQSHPNTIHPIIQLSNVGREGHTYLHYIITNYEQLEDYTIFLQGYPFDHSRNLEDKLKDFQKRINEEKQVISFEYISQNIISSNIERCPTDITLNLIPTYKTVFGIDKTNHPFIFGAGAQFIVSKETILSRPKSFYENMITLLDYDINPYEGFVIERLWNMVFTHSE